MFFFLSKIFQFIFSPLTWILVLFTISFIIKKEQKTAKHLRVIAFSLLLFFSNPFIFYECMRAWESEAKQKSEIKEYYDYGIVLTGMITYDDKYDRINFNSSNDRLLQAVELYKEKRIGKLFITGGSGEIFDQSVKESEILKDYLIILGIPEEDIEIEANSKNTYENAVETAKILKPEEMGQNYILITSAYHMRRAEGCFKKQGFNCDTYVTERYAGKRIFTPDKFLPQPEIFQSWALLIHEISGYIIYDVTGKL